MNVFTRYGKKKRIRTRAKEGRGTSIIDQPPPLTASIHPLTFWLCRDLKERAKKPLSFGHVFVEQRIYQFGPSGHFPRKRGCMHFFYYF